MHVISVTCELRCCKIVNIPFGTQAIRTNRCKALEVNLVKGDTQIRKKTATLIGDDFWRL